MNISSIVQYATLFSLIVGLLGVAIALLNNRQQLETQIFLTLAARYDQLLETSGSAFSASLDSENNVPELSEELTVSVLRYYSQVFLLFFMYKWGRIPGKMWKLILPSVERRLRNPLVVREWKLLQKEFDDFPDFSSFVLTVQRETTSCRR